MVFVIVIIIIIMVAIIIIFIVVTHLLLFLLLCVYDYMGTVPLSFVVEKNYEYCLVLGAISPESTCPFHRQQQSEHKIEKNRLITRHCTWWKSMLEINKLSVNNWKSKHGSEVHCINSWSRHTIIIYKGIKIGRW